MSKLEDLRPTASIKGILPDALVTVVSVGWHGSDALTLVYRGPNGRVAEEILYRHDEPRLDIVEAGRPWSFEGDGSPSPRTKFSIPLTSRRTSFSPLSSLTTTITECITSADLSNANRTSA